MSPYCGSVYLLIGLPVLANAVLIGLLLAYMNAKIDGLPLRNQ